MSVVLLQTLVLDSSLMTIMDRNITNKNDIEKLQKDLDTLGGEGGREMG